MNDENENILAKLLQDALKKIKNDDVLLNMEEAANFCRYESKVAFMNWVRRYNIPYETRGKAKFFFESNLRKGLVKAQKTSQIKVAL